MAKTFSREQIPVGGPVQLGYIHPQTLRIGLQSITCMMNGMVRLVK
jgi:hypothetical protein